MQEIISKWLTSVLPFAQLLDRDDQTDDVLTKPAASWSVPAYAYIPGYTILSPRKSLAYFHMGLELWTLKIMLTK